LVRLQCGGPAGGPPFCYNGAVRTSSPRKQKTPTSQLPDDFIYGINPLTEALAAGAVKRVFMAASRSERLGDLRKLIEKKGIQIEDLQGAPWYPALESTPHQGVAALIRPFRGELLSDVLAGLPPEAAMLFLDGVNDPQNLGAAIRSAAAAGAPVVLPKFGVAPVNCTVHKASAGMTFRTPIVFGENLAQAVDSLKDKGFWVASLDAHGGDSMFTFEFPKRMAFVIGSEDRGVRRLLREKSDYVLNIPMRADVESLNLGVSAALALFFFRAYWARKAE
jgi:23S rRNA (guanosine2251-2'-O)-methyltransferase